ncbi:MAG TPA: magnesium/cobalt transporter CorA [Bacteroidales bacterium]|nr:magnesium/cobalt transporter CorA [Bacteroidales bacterium]
MKKNRANITKKAGLPPESLVYTGNRKPSPAEIELLVYDQESCRKLQITNPAELSGAIDINKVNLLILNNITDVTLIENLGKHFGIETMALEDVLNTEHLPKVEEYGDQLLFTLKLIEISGEGELMRQHVSLILGDNYVIVFNDFENGIFEDLKSRIESGKSKARQRKADYLFYILTDTLVDSYYGVVNELIIKIDKLEEKLLEEPQLNYIHSIYQVKMMINDLRGVVLPLREALLNIVQGDFNRFGEDTLTYFRDVRDHINHIIHMVESGRDNLFGLIELNSSNTNNRLNGSMKIMTIITTLFIPLTLIAGIYGMNFRFMPEVGWKAGYPLAIILMIITAVIMYFIIRRNKLL